MTPYDLDTRESTYICNCTIIDPACSPLLTPVGHLPREVVQIMLGSRGSIMFYSGTLVHGFNPKRNRKSEAKKVAGPTVEEQVWLLHTPGFLIHKTLVWFKTHLFCQRQVHSSIENVWSVSSQRVCTGLCFSCKGCSEVKPRLGIWDDKDYDRLPKERQNPLMRIHT